MSLMIEVEECFTLTDLPELELAFGDRRIAEIAFTTAKHAHGTILHLTGRVEHVNGPNAIEVKVFSGAPHF
jgi:hypothetical protein